MKPQRYTMNHADDNHRGLSIVIPNYNGAGLLKEFLPGVIRAARAYPGRSEIIVIDDKSSDKSLETLQEFSGITVIEHEKNYGFGRACNTGMQHAAFEIIFFQNNDVELTDDFFAYFNPYFDHPDTFAVTVIGCDFKTGRPLDGGKVGFWRRGYPRFTDNYYPEDYPSLQPPYLSFGVQGAYFFVAKDKLLDLGGFDDLYLPYIYEETDLCYRALKRGWKIFFEPKCRTRHKHSVTLKTVSSQSFRKMISYRNRLIFIWKNISDPGYLFNHLFFLVLSLLFRPSFNYWKAFVSALKRLPQIKAKRRVEKSQQKISDRAIFNFYTSYYQKNRIL